LENSTFFTDLPLELPSGATVLNHDTVSQVVDYIDHATQELMESSSWDADFQRRTQYTENIITDPLQRGICFTVAQGTLDHDVWRSFVPEGTRILRTIDADVALPFLNYNGKSSLSKPRYNLAYIIVVHDNLGNVLALISALDDPSVFIYVHIDMSAPKSFREALQNVANTRTNVVVMPTAFSVTWGHITVLWAQLRAFFDLLDLVDFEYVINLSGSDYPIKSPQSIYHHLQLRPGNNWLWWEDDPEVHSRMEGMFHCGQTGTTRCTPEPFEWGFRSWDCLADIFPVRYKSSQWVILHHSAVKYLRDSESGKLLMMWAEHTMVPDEMILGTFFASSPFARRIIPDAKRLMWWDGSGRHPHDFWHGDASMIDWAQIYFMWIRKVDVTRDHQLRQMLDGFRAEDTMSARAFTPYTDGFPDGFPDP
jgi:hypothetical protein